MKQDEIEKGKRYTDGRGRVREASKIYKPNPFGLNESLLKSVSRVTYWTIEDGRGYVQEQDCTLATFARWAREEVET